VIYFPSTEWCVSTRAKQKAPDKSDVNGHSISEGPQFGACFVSLFWYLEFGTGS